MGSNSVPSLAWLLPLNPSSLKIRNEIQDDYQANTFGLEVKNLIQHYMTLKCN